MNRVSVDDAQKVLFIDELQELANQLSYFYYRGDTDCVHYYAKSVIIKAIPLIIRRFATNTE